MNMFPAAFSPRPRAVSVCVLLCLGLRLALPAPAMGLSPDELERQEELAREIEEVTRAKKDEIVRANPFYLLKGMTIKDFGKWSEDFLKTNVVTFVREDGKGFDGWAKNHTVKVEVKSSRTDRSRKEGEHTFNQLHPHDCDQFLFLIYNTDLFSLDIFYFPSSLLLSDPPVLSVTAQHDRGLSGCFSLSLTAKNRQVLGAYRVDSLETLTELMR